MPAEFSDQGECVTLDVERFRVIHGQTDLAFWDAWMRGLSLAEAPA